MAEPREPNCPHCDLAVAGRPAACPHCARELHWCSNPKCPDPINLPGGKFCGGCGLCWEAPQAKADTKHPTRIHPEGTPGPQAALVHAASAGMGHAAQQLETLLQEVAAAFPAPTATLPGPKLLAKPPFGSLPAVQVPGAPASTASLLVRVEEGKTYRCHRQGILGVRVSFLGGADEVHVRVTVTSRLFSPKTLTGKLRPGVEQALPPLEFIPRVAGEHALSWEVLARTPDRVPLGLWTATTRVTVEDSVEKPDLVREILTGQLSTPRGTPTTVELVSHPDYEGLPRVAPERLWPATRPFRALIRVEDLEAQRAVGVVVAAGESARLGRGGKPEVDWLVKAEPAHPDVQAISRHHLTFRLRDDQGGCEDWSQFGTWHNGRRLPGHQFQELATEDRLVLGPNVLSLAVEAVRVGSVTHGLWVHRQDGLGDRLMYLLSDCRTPVAFPPRSRGPCGLWLAWQRGRGANPELAVCPPGAKVWTVAEENVTRAWAGRHRLRWQTLSDFAEQDSLVALLSRG